MIILTITLHADMLLRQSGSMVDKGKEIGGKKPSPLCMNQPYEFPHALSYQKPSISAVFVYESVLLWSFCCWNPWLRKKERACYCYEWRWWICLTWTWLIIMKSFLTLRPLSLTVGALPSSKLIVRRCMDANAAEPSSDPIAGTLHLHFTYTHSYTFFILYVI